MFPTAASINTHSITIWRAARTFFKAFPLKLVEKKVLNWKRFKGRDKEKITFYFLLTFFRKPRLHFSVDHITLFPKKCFICIPTIYVLSHTFTHTTRQTFLSFSLTLVRLRESCAGEIHRIKVDCSYMFISKICGGFYAYVCRYTTSAQYNAQML